MSDLPMEMPQAWPRLSDTGLKALKIASSTHKTKHGLYANIPITCRGDKCPYADTCPAYAEGVVPINEPCPVEISLICELLQRYITELGIDQSQFINGEIIKDLIDAEITIYRCDCLLAKDGSIVQDVVVSITPQGREVRRPEPHVALGIRDRARMEKHRCLRLLNSTPKDKVNAPDLNRDPSTWASKIYKIAGQLEEISIRETVVDGQVVDENHS